MEENGLRKELKLSNMISMAAGGMIAVWMVEIKFWFELSGVGSVLSLLTCALLILPLCLIYSEMTSMMPYAGNRTESRMTGFSSKSGIKDFPGSFVCQKVLPFSVSMCA